MHMDDPLNEEFTLMDVAYIYRWRRVNVIRKLVCVWAPGELGVTDILCQ
jgi:hypothetical protein